MLLLLLPAGKGKEEMDEEEERLQAPAEDIAEKVDAMALRNRNELD